MVMECIHNLGEQCTHSQVQFPGSLSGSARLSDIYIPSLFEEYPFRFLTLKKSCPSLYPVPVTIMLVSFYQWFSNDITKEKKKEKKKLDAMTDC